MIKKTFVLVVALASSLGPAPGVDAKPAGPRFLQGSAAKENIDRVNNNIQWHTSLNQAMEQARKEDKMVFWVHLIGQMSGST